MTFWNKKIASRKTQKWFIVLVLTGVIFCGFEILSFLTGIYQIPHFVAAAFTFYAFLIVYTTLIFDLKLKVPKSWERSKIYFAHNKQDFLKWFRIIVRAFAMRFHYFSSWQHWLHFQNYLILPAILYWGTVVMIFLNPFSGALKQISAVCGAVLLAVVVWYMKTVFISYSSVNQQIKNLMFTAQVIASLLVFSGLLGLVWYFGLPASNFVLGGVVLAFLLMYQSLFRLQAVNLKNVFLVLLGSLAVGGTAAIVFRYWTVNFYTGGLMLANVQYFYWSWMRLKISRRFTARLLIEHILVFIFVVFFILATTNFNARIG
ncbi:MAG: hypothetical protein AAB871_03765 [Patescibacteria group bacterium]